MIPREVIATERLQLRPTEASDAARALQIQSNWNVTRMLRLAAYPPDPAGLASWFAGHAADWRRGAAYRFAILSSGEMIGIVDLDEVDGEQADLGYWLDEPFWGRGYAREAAGALVTFGFETLGLARLNSGHAADNPASGKILVALGFRPTGSAQVASRSRGVDITQQRYVLLARP